MSKNLLKEAIADAKAVKETAIANAKLALEEAFAPKIQSMLASKLSEEETDEMEDEDDMPVADTPSEEPAADVAMDSMDDEAEEMAMNDEEETDEMEEGDYSENETDEMEKDEELEEIIKELEADENDEMSEEEADEMMNADEADMDEEEKDEMEDKDEMKEGEHADENEDADESLEEIIKSLTEEDDVDEEEVEENVTNEELEEAYKVIKYLRAKINEVNLLNAKLLFSNKIFRNKSLSESQKMRVIENFDRAKSVREVKLVYTTLAESLVKASKPRVTEGFASKGTNSTAPSKEIINESNDFTSRMKRLAGL